MSDSLRDKIADVVEGVLKGDYPNGADYVIADRIEEMLGEYMMSNVALRDALRFYADETMYVVSGIPEPPAAPIKIDGGRKAREALKLLD